MKCKKLRAYLKERFSWWTHNTGLGWWKVDILYDDDRQAYEGENGYETVMRCFADWRYGTAQVYVNVLKAKTLDKQELEMCVVHELMHVFLNEMREGEIKHEERVATTLAKAFLWCRDGVERGYNNKTSEEIVPLGQRQIYTDRDRQGRRTRVI